MPTPHSTLHSLAFSKIHIFPARAHAVRAAIPMAAGLYPSERKGETV